MPPKAQAGSSNQAPPQPQAGPAGGTFNSKPFWNDDQLKAVAEAVRNETEDYAMRAEVHYLPFSKITPGKRAFEVCPLVEGGDEAGPLKMTERNVSKVNGAYGKIACHGTIERNLSTNQWVKDGPKIDKIVGLGLGRGSSVESVLHHKIFAHVVYCILNATFTNFGPVRAEGISVIYQASDTPYPVSAHPPAALREKSTELNDVVGMERSMSFKFPVKAVHDPDGLSAIDNSTFVVYFNCSEPWRQLIGDRCCSQDGTPRFYPAGLIGYDVDEQSFPLHDEYSEKLAGIFKQRQKLVEPQPTYRRIDLITRTESIHDGEGRKGKFMPVALAPIPMYLKNIKL